MKVDQDENDNYGLIRIMMVMVVMMMTLILIDHDSMMGSCLTTHSQSHTLTFHHLRTLVTSDDSEGI